ncbi:MULTISPECIES: HXXEE domain-containing protein [unclassified Virgibacillus]|uniref:HXXEE domain-containing protein n=1 Tax=unclassified Virgibacillus TaxID=2620237 RepID=UPI001E40C1C3|nr:MULTISPECIES: HXXEE domain-containing protein [unclassified Virgibacillus]
MISLVASLLLIITVTTQYYFLFLGLNMLFALNIFTHPIQAILLRCYMPGVWTTLLLILPYNIIFFYHFYNRRFTNNKHDFKWISSNGSMYAICVSWS